ncbi:MAG: arylsulfatase [Planctomycetes bacterium]|nr:arylsulfatase [Planctomycetota bacterium]
MTRKFDRRSLLKVVGGAAGAMALPSLLRAATGRQPAAPAGRAAAAAGASGRAAERPNILLIMADDMGFSDLGCYGGEIRTPNLDALAGRGIRFTQFYNNTKCGPTRATLLTGLYSQAISEGRMLGAVTIAEALRPAGYRTLMTGKWHAPDIPVHRGFDRYFGLCDGCCNYWNPGRQREGEPPPGRKWSRWRRWAIDEKEYLPYTPADRRFYTTDAFTDYALKYLDQYYGPSADPQEASKPFFLYIAYTAPHYPLHAWPEDIARYRGKYRIGWDELRKRRFARQVELGLFDKSLRMSPRDAGNPAWEDVPQKARDSWDLKMAVYAAMIDRMDQNIGRVIAKLRQLGKLDNTLVLFLSDNGGCAEQIHKTPDVPPGPLAGYHTVDAPWANASNTPFRKYKTWDHEGGTCTPLIAHWPARIKKPGRITDQPGHIIDVMATCLDAAGASYPRTYAGRKILPLDGLSLLPILDGRRRKGHDAIFWQYHHCRAVRRGDWKLVAGRDGKWALYDLSKDRTELNDLASAEPDRAQEMARMYEAWRARCHRLAAAARS